MSTSFRPLRIAFIHPDLGIGGAERLVVDAALGLQELGHTVDLYTSHHDPKHCFEETRDGTLQVHHIVPPFPRAIKGKFHILFAHARQLHLTAHLLSSSAPRYDVYFVDQLSTCIPLLRVLGETRVVFYCHFPDKLLANGAFVEGQSFRKQGSLLKRLYRMPMDWLEEITTRQSDVILANSRFTARVFRAYFSSITQTPRIVYPGINLSAYASQSSAQDDVLPMTLNRPTLLSLNRFEGKKNALLALQAFALVKKDSRHQTLRLILAGGYDPRLADNVHTLSTLVDSARSLGLSYTLISPVPLPSTASSLVPSSTPKPGEVDVVFLLNFATSQRTALLLSPNTLGLLYTPENEHFGIVPVEAMACGLPVLACNSGGPTESVLAPSESDDDLEERTGWLKPPSADVWAEVLAKMVALTPQQRSELGTRARERARNLFGMEAMARGIDKALRDAKALGRVDVWQREVRPWIFFFVALIVGVFLALYVLP